MNIKFATFNILATNNEYFNKKTSENIKKIFKS